MNRATPRSNTARPYCRRPATPCMIVLFAGGTMILIVNSGSSSLKVALYRRHPHLEPDVTATVDRLDRASGRWTTRVANRPDPEAGAHSLASHAEALTEFLAWVE